MDIRFALELRKHPPKKQREMIALAASVESYKVQSDVGWLALLVVAALLAIGTVSSM